MADEIEAVDAAEVAALERAADMPSHAEAAAADVARDRTERALKPHAYEDVGTGLCGLCALSLAAKLHVEGATPPPPSADWMQHRTSGAPSEYTGLHPNEVRANIDKVAGVHPAMAGAAPKGALESLVETLVEQAVGARLAALARELQATRRYALHTMHLVVVLADRFNVTPEQLAGAYAATQEAEAAQGRQR